MVANNILIVGSNVVCNDYKQQQMAQLEAKANNLLEEIDCELNGFMLYKQQVVNDTKAAKNRVDNKFVLAYS